MTSAVPANGIDAAFISGRIRASGVVFAALGKALCVYSRRGKPEIGNGHMRWILAVGKQEYGYCLLFYNKISRQTVRNWPTSSLNSVENL